MDNYPYRSCFIGLISTATQTLLWRSIKGCRSKLVSLTQNGKNKKTKQTLSAISRKKLGTSTK